MYGYSFRRYGARGTPADRAAGGGGGAGADASGPLVRSGRPAVVLLRKGETLEGVMQFW